jgi:acetolactate synthase I/II/III large subunit
MKIKVVDYIANFLVEKNIEHIFTVTGGGAMHLNVAFGHHEKLRCIYNHHEQACAIAAEAYYKYSGKLSAVCVTSGPGGTNALTGVLCGWLDSIPMFIISGQVKRETTIHATDIPLRQLGDQEFDIVSCVGSMTKYAQIVLDPNEIAYHLEKAYYLSLTGRGGPVWLDIPLDIQASIIDTDDIRHFNSTIEYGYKVKPSYNNRNTETIIEKIKSAKCPVILAGTGVRLAQARDKFLELIEMLQIPVLTAWNAHDVLWNDHPLFVGKPGTVGTRGGNFVAQNCDLLIVFGSRLNLRQVSYNYHQFADNAYKIVVDIDKNELYKPTVNIDFPIWADLTDVLDDMVKKDLSICHSREHENWLAWCKKTNLKYPATLPDYYGNKELNPYVFIKEFTNNLKIDDKIICGNGSACVITFQAAELKADNRMFTNSGCATMGYGLPAAIGVCIAENNKGRVICIDGDGSFQMNVQEMQTVVYNKLNIKIIYLNNNGYHSMRQTQKNLFDNSLVGVCEGNGISFPEIKRIAYGYDVPFIQISNENDINLIYDFMEQEGPVICEIIVDPNQNFEPKLSSKVLPDGKIVSPPIDDMFPFLSREEYESNKYSYK